jgi:hypothetical protein
LIIIFFAACIPADTAPNRSATPGAGAMITRDTYQNELFSVSYPAGWRVITSPASAPPSVTFVAPGDCALIVVSSAPIDAPPTAPACDQADIQTVDRTVMLDGQQIVVAGSVPASDWDEFVAALDRVAASLKASA